MKKSIILFLFLATSLFADFQVSYLKTQKHYTNINEVIDQSFTNIPSKISFGLKKNVWLKVAP